MFKQTSSSSYNCVLCTIPNLLAASAFTSSVETGGFFGGIIAGWLTDIALRRRAAAAARLQPATTPLARRSQQQGNARLPVAIFFMFGVTGCLHLLLTVDQNSSQLLISTIGFVLGGCLYGPIAIFGVAASESAPTHLSGTAHAVVALAANG